MSLLIVVWLNQEVVLFCQPQKDLEYPQERPDLEVVEMFENISRSPLPDTGGKFERTLKISPLVPQYLPT